MPLLPQGEWPPTLGRSQYSEITMVERDRLTLPDQATVEENLQASFHGQVDKLAKNEKVIESLDEVFIAQPDDFNSSLSLKVLVEGVPGAGKTTLVQKTCKDWADGTSLQQFNLVVSVALRKKEIERAKSVEELLPGDDPVLKQEVIKTINESSGECVLFIFDGFDELNEIQPSSTSFFLKVIQGELLHNCAAILTSRPYASDVLRTDERIHRHVEILGFTEKQIESYIMHNIADQSTAHSLLKSEQTAITFLGYTPLSCSILLYIFKQEKFKLPSTLTELFDVFISSILKRHAKKLELLTRTQEQKLDLNNLPEPLKYQFKALCKLAYDSLVEGKFLFSRLDIENMYPGGADVEANLLSLMTSATSFSIHGEETHYQFLHMTIQEFLAARWIATQSKNEQKKFLSKKCSNLKLKPMLAFFAGFTKLEGYLFDVLLETICHSDLHSVLIGLERENSRKFLHSFHEVCEDPSTTTTEALQATDPFVVKLRITPGKPAKDPFKFETVVVSSLHPSVSRPSVSRPSVLRPSVSRPSVLHPAVLHPSVSRPSVSRPSVSRPSGICRPKYNSDAAQAFLCLSSMLSETKDPSLVRRIFELEGLLIEGIYLDFCRLPLMDCTAVVKFLSNCPCHIPRLHFNFCNLTNVSLRIFHRVSMTTPNCWNQCTEVQMNYNAPSFSASLFLLPEIQWFQHTKILCLRGLQYPKGHPPETFQLHSLLSLKALSDLTVTVEKIPTDHLKDHEAVLRKFFEALRSNKTLITLTYDQTPATNCELFVQLMSALMQNKLSLTLGSAQVITESAVILPSKTCFKICPSGLVSAVKLADTRSIPVLEAHLQDLFLESCTCQSSNESKLEPRLTTTCDQCDITDPAAAVTYCFNCSANYCESCSKAVHQFKVFKNHMLIPIERISPEFNTVADLFKSSSLAVLDISECTLTNEVAKHIGAGLAVNKSLKQLNIKTLDDGGAVHIFRALEHNSSVQKLKISLDKGIGSSETAVAALSQMLKVNKSLVVLDLSGFGVTDLVAKCIASRLARNSTLRALNTNSDKLKNESAGYILQSLKQNETLNTLRVFDLHIQITRAPLTLIIAAGTSNKQSLSLLASSLIHTSIDKLQMFTSTGVLDLSKCGITDAMVKKIAAGLTENSPLKQLDLSGNEITSVGAAHIFRSLEHNTSLCRLLLSHNPQLAMGDSELFGSRLKKLLTTNKSLTVLDLSGCGVTDEVAQHITRGLTENKTLKALSVDSEYLTHEGITCIYQSLKQTEAMKILKQFGINLEIFYKPFSFVTSIDQDTQTALNVFKLLEQDTTVEGLVLCKLPTSDRTGDNKDDEVLGCAVEGLLTANQTLRILKLQNCLNDVIAGHIATGLAVNNSAKQLILNLKITRVGAARIFKSLEHNTSLEELHLSFFSLLSKYENDEELALGHAVERMLTVNQTLRILNLQGYHVNDKFACHIANGLAENSSVKQLNLKSNKITTVGAVNIFESLEGRKTNLEKLHLSSDQFLPSSNHSSSHSSNHSSSYEPDNSKTPGCVGNLQHNSSCSVDTNPNHNPPKKRRCCIM